jgi:hypothetical protein
VVVVVVVVGFSLIVDCDGRSSTSTSQAQTVVPKLGGWKIGEKRFFFLFLFTFPSQSKTSCAYSAIHDASPPALCLPLSLCCIVTIYRSAVRGHPVAWVVLPLWKKKGGLVLPLFCASGSVAQAPVDRHIVHGHQVGSASECGWRI